MENFFFGTPKFVYQLLDINKTASIIILVVLLLRLLIKKFPKKYSYVLWSVVGFRLMCPFSFKSIFSIFNITTIINSRVEVGSNVNQIVDFMKPEYITQTDKLNDLVFINNQNYINVYDFFKGQEMYIWFIVFIFMVFYSILSYFNVKELVKNSILLKGNIYQCENIKSPFVIGFIKPKIIIPYHLEEHVQKIIIEHEQYHIKRKDYLIRLLAYGLSVIHWFNPLVWVAYFSFIKDMEMSCDEYVLSKNNDNKTYSYTLLSIASNNEFSVPKPLAFGENDVKNRIKNILRYKQPSKLVAVISIIISMFALVAFSSNPTYQRLSNLYGQPRIDDSKEIVVTMYDSEINQITYEYELSNDLLIEPFEKLLNEVQVSKYKTNEQIVNEENILLKIVILNKDNEQIILKFSDDLYTFNIEYRDKVIYGYQIENPRLIEGLSFDSEDMTSYGYNSDDNENRLLETSITLHSSGYRVFDNYKRNEYANFQIYTRDGKIFSVRANYEIIDNKLILHDKDEPGKYVFDIHHDEYDYYFTYNENESTKLPDKFNLLTEFQKIISYKYRQYYK